MATKVPISVENIAFERLNLSRHYLTIDCDFTCFLVLNPSGSVPSEGTDICALHVGAWQIDAWTLLTKKDFPNQAGFSACLVWDKTLVVEGSTSIPHVVESDIDTANSVSTLKGQPVNITGFSMPDGDALPTWLVLGPGGEVVSRDNPLPVVNIPVSIYLKVGDTADVSRIRTVSSSIREVGAVTRYRIIPKRFTVAGDNGKIHFYTDKFIHESNSDSNCTKYMPLESPSIVTIVDNETGLVSGFEFGLRGVGLYADTSLARDVGSQLGGNFQFWIIEV